MSTFRHELKFEYNINASNSLIERLPYILKLDEHGKDGMYKISSLYFDDYYDSCAFDNELGLARRYKYRIRYYNNDSDVLNLELKEKINGLCRKQKCRLSIDEYYAILNENFGELLYRKEKPLLVKFAKDMLCKQLKPKIITDYYRTAYVLRPLNIRITIDSNISASNEISRFLKGDYIKYPLLSDSFNVLEVKYDSFLPSYIKELCTDRGMVRQSFSKYYLGRQLLREYKML